MGKYENNGDANAVTEAKIFIKESWEPLRPLSSPQTPQRVKNGRQLQILRGKKGRDRSGGGQRGAELAEQRREFMNNTDSSEAKPLRHE